MLILLIVALLLLVGFAISGPLGAPWVPARKKDVNSIMHDIKLQKGQIYIELGCGDGRLVSAAAREGAIAIGYEINPLLWVVAMIRNARYENAHIRLGNFWNKDISDADTVMVFLMPKFMVRLEKKLSKELHTGATVVSYIFALPNKKPKIKRASWSVYTF